MKLEALVKKGTSAAFCRSESPLDIRERVLLEQLAALAREDDRVAKHPLADGEMLFDRLLLAYSPIYRHTRLAARRLGVTFRRQYITRDRALVQWDPSRLDIPYTPVQSELRWLLRDPRAFDRATWKAFESLRSGLIPMMFHELNHVIIFSSLRPVNATGRKAIHRHYALNEGLVRIRDLEQAEELGMAAAPLFSGGALNYRLPPERAAAAGPMTLEKFSTLLIGYLFVILGYPRGERDLRLRRAPAGAKFAPEILREYAEFSGETPPDTLPRVVAGLGNAVRLPPLAKHLPRLRYEPLAPGQYLRHPEKMRELYDWYCELLPPKARLAPASARS